MTTTATTTATPISPVTSSFALIGWQIVEIIGFDSQSGLVLVKDVQDGTYGLVQRSILLHLHAVKAAAVKVIINDEMTPAEIIATTTTDSNGNRWALVDFGGRIEITHFSRVLVG